MLRKALVVAGFFAAGYVAANVLAVRGVQRSYFRS